MIIDGIVQRAEGQPSRIVQSIWSALFASFFVFFFFLPDLSSLIGKCMLIAAVPFYWMTRDRAVAVRWALLCLMLLPLLVYLVSMAVHGWDLRQLARPAHLLLAALLFIALRPLRLQTSWITGGMALGMLPALFVALHEHYIQQVDRVFGPLSGADFGNFAASLSLPFIMGGLLMDGRTWTRMSRLAYVAAGIAAALIAFWSGSRTAWLIMIVTACVLPLLGAVSPARRGQLWWGAALVIVPLVVAWPVFSERMQRMVQEVAAFTSADAASYQGTSMGIRLESLQIGLQLCKAHPLGGIGFLGFKEHVQGLADAGLISRDIPGFFGMLHNQFLDFCVLGGLPALIALCAFWAGMLWLASAVALHATDHRDKLLALCLASVLIGYFISATGGSMFSSTKGSVFLGVCLVLLFLLDTMRRPIGQAGR